MQIKIFSGFPKNVEKEVNEYLQNIPNQDIIDIKIAYSEGTSNYLGIAVVMVITKN